MDSKSRYDTTINRYTIFQNEDRGKEQNRLAYKRIVHQKNSDWIDNRKDYDQTMAETRGKGKIGKVIPDFVQIGSGGGI